jgi:hypothetical protein
MPPVYRGRRLSRIFSSSLVSSNSKSEAPFGRNNGDKSVNGDKEEGPTAFEKNKSEKRKGGNKHDFSRDHRVCRVVASPDGKLPTAKSALPAEILSSPPLLEKLDAIYHAISHEEARRLPYIERSQKTEPVFNQEEETTLVSVLRNSLDDAGFALLTQRDIDLCEALNAGYLLRLSIEPDVSGFDPSIARQFYPEQFDKDCNPTKEFPFEGRVLLYRRGYSSEVTEGRLILPKLDYLQASIVQGTIRRLTEILGAAKTQKVLTLTAISRSVLVVMQSSLAAVADNVPSKSVAEFLRSEWGWRKVDPETLPHNETDIAKPSSVKLTRYEGKNRFLGFGSPMNSGDALDPFLECVVTDDSGNALNAEYFGMVNGELDANGFPCQYDAKNNDHQNSFLNTSAPRLERVSINNVVDLSTALGRRNVVKRFFSKSQLVEPTYEEVIAIWRPLLEKPVSKPKLVPPKFVYDVAEIFEIDDKLPELPVPEPEPLPCPLEIRAFDGVPMANTPAVLPKTKLLFRPADAFVFDLVTIVSLFAVFGSVRFDNPRLDLLALVSGTLWIIRTAIRYSNKLARYDLLVKKFLTSKISHRNSGALKYITRDAGTQRAIRAALVYLWLTRLRKRTEGGIITRQSLIKDGSSGVNDILKTSKPVRVDIEAALNDLVDLDLICFSEDGETLFFVRDDETVVETLKTTWNNLFEDKLSLRRMLGRRSR